jgi:hypothetical protein
MMGTMNCTYETPCGWCTKWDKKCDKKIPEPPIINQYDYLTKTPTNQTCQSEEDHRWVPCGISTGEATYYCTICGKHKTEPIKKQENGTILTYLNKGSIPCFECVHVANYSPQCIDCNVANGFQHFEGEGQNQ